MNVCFLFEPTSESQPTIAELFPLLYTKLYLYLNRLYLFSCNLAYYNIVIVLDPISDTVLENFY